MVGSSFYGPNLQPYFDASADPLLESSSFYGANPDPTFQGPQGPKGDQGERGPPGEQGPKGDPGTSGVQLATLINASNDAAAASSGVAVGALYRNGSILMIRVS